MAKIMQQTQQKPSKPVNATGKGKGKGAGTKPAQDVATAPVAAFSAYAAIAAFVTSALEGKADKRIRGFYESAIKNHTKLGTSFPRTKTAEERGKIAVMDKTAIAAMLGEISKAILIDGRGAAGRKDSQAVFDIYMASKSPK